MGIAKKLGRKVREAAKAAAAPFTNTGIYREVDRTMKDLEKFYSENPLIGPELGNITKQIRDESERDEAALQVARDEAKAATVARIDAVYEGKILRRRIQALREEAAAAKASPLWGAKRSPWGTVTRK